MLWPFLAVYCVGYVGAFWRICGQFAWYRWSNEHRKFGPKTPDTAQWVGAICIAFLCAFVWPLSLPCAMLINRRGNQKFFYRPPEIRERDYKERIAALERECGIA